MAAVTATQVAERFHDRAAARYRWRGRDAEDGCVEVEQPGYLRIESDGKLIAMNVADSGFAPVA